jgi:hypothetical protein
MYKHGFSGMLTAGVWLRLKNPRAGTRFVASSARPESSVLLSPVQFAVPMFP